jgi:hypothetical protein
VARMGGREGACSILVGRPEGKTPLGRPKRRWGDNITVDIQKVAGEAWTGLLWLGQGQMEGCCERGNGPPGFIIAQDLLASQ